VTRANPDCDTRLIENRALSVACAALAAEPTYRLDNAPSQMVSDRRGSRTLPVAPPLDAAAPCGCHGAPFTFPPNPNCGKAPAAEPSGKTGQLAECGKPRIGAGGSPRLVARREGECTEPSQRCELAQGWTIPCTSLTGEAGASNLPKSFNWRKGSVPALTPCRGSGLRRTPPIDSHNLQKMEKAWFGLWETSFCESSLPSNAVGNAL
jgi:hypothetical protein